MGKPGEPHAGYERRYKVLVGLRGGVFILMVFGAGLPLMMIHDLGGWEALPLGILLGAGARTVNNALTDAMARWVWPDLEAETEK